MESPQQVKSDPAAPAAVYTAPREISVHHVARLMKMRGARAVVVVDALIPVGLVTDRDIVLRVTAAGLDAARVPVGTIMTTPLITMTSADRVDDAVALMDRHAVRQLPIVNQAGHLVSLLGLDDLLRLKRAGTATFAGLAQTETAFSPPSKTGATAPITKFSELGAPSPVQQQTTAPVTVRPVMVVPMIERRRWARLFFAARTWYQTNTKWVLLVIAVAVVGAGIAMVLRSFYDYEGSFYEPKDVSRERQARP